MEESSDKGRKPTTGSNMFTARFEPRPATGVLRVSQGTRVQTWRDLSDAVCAYGHAGPGWWAMELPRFGTFLLERAAPDTIRIFAEPGASRDRLEDLYRRSVVPVFLQALGHETLHASAVTAAGGVLAFCGERGAGKSTIAYALARRGFAQHADDTLVLTVARDSVTTQPLPFAPRLRPPSAAFFNADPRGGSAAKTSAAAGRLSALFILQRAAAPSTLDVAKLPASQAFQAMLAHAHCFEPDNPLVRQRLLKNYLDISARIPVFRVTYTPGLDRLDALLDEMTEAAGLARGASAVTGTAVAV
jgi:hypothetical protein